MAENEKKPKKLNGYELLLLYLGVPFFIFCAIVARGMQLMSRGIFGVQVFDREVGWLVIAFAAWVVYYILLYLIRRCIRFLRSKGWLRIPDSVREVFMTVLAFVVIVGILYYFSQIIQ